jgi:hypothetical protein
VEEENLTPDELSDLLQKQIVLSRKAKVPVNYQYQVPYQDILKQVERDDIQEPLSQERLDYLRDTKFTRKWHMH